MRTVDGKPAGLVRRNFVRVEVARRRVREMEHEFKQQAERLVALEMHGQRTEHTRSMLKAQLDFLRISYDYLTVEEAEARQRWRRRSHE
jgi:hypothetical protein